MAQRERFSSHTGFILISAGCAIGLGNVYRFPIITGSYGGALFVLFYLLCLLLMGIPVMVIEMAVGRSSRAGAAAAFNRLEPPSTYWHLGKYLIILANYMLMMFYTVIASWMVIYFAKYAFGKVSSVTDSQAIQNIFSQMLENKALLLSVTCCLIIVCFAICSLGFQKGVEKTSKYMMVFLLLLIVVLAIHSCTLDGAAEGLRFYLLPSAQAVKDRGVGPLFFAALGQAFFSLSIGLGSLEIFGSYMDRKRRLLGEALTVAGLDTFVAITSGIIIFPACFTYGGGISEDPDSIGASFLFTTLSRLFNNMSWGRLWGSLFFLFMIFASVSTVIGVFENIVAFWTDRYAVSRKKVCLLNAPLLCLLSLPCVLYTDFLDFCDITVSNLLMPLGSIVFIRFCTAKCGWGWKNFIAEANTGKGLLFPPSSRIYLTYILPPLILTILILLLL